MKAKNIFVALSLIAFATIESKSNGFSLGKINSGSFVDSYYNDLVEMVESKSIANVYQTQMLNSFKSTFLSLQFDENEINLNLPRFKTKAKNKTLDAQPFHIIQLPLNQ